MLDEDTKVSVNKILEASPKNVNDAGEALALAFAVWGKGKEKLAIELIQMLAKAIAIIDRELKHHDPD